MSNTSKETPNPLVQPTRMKPRAAAQARWKASAMRLLMVASILLVTVACSGAGEFDRRTSSADENYVSELAGALDAAGVDFRAPRDGSIAYRSRDEDTLRSIEERLKKDIAAGTYVKLESEEHKKQFISLLNAGRKRYRVERRPDGEWIRWYPSSDEEAREVTVRALGSSSAVRATAKR